MKKFTLFIFLSLCWTAPSMAANPYVGNNLSAYYPREDVVLVTSTGRSGSRLLTHHLKDIAKDHLVLKSHALPPTKEFRGKILFIFSSPDQSAESVLHKFLADRVFASLHYRNIEGADRDWFTSLRHPSEQTLEKNLLAYDALKIHSHLETWLINKTTPSSLEKAQVLALKYENLWDEDVQQAICDFLQLEELNFPQRKPRGTYRMVEKEKVFRAAYNLGTEQEPRYEAYDEARKLWEEAPPFQFLELL